MTPPGCIHRQRNSGDDTIENPSWLAYLMVTVHRAFGYRFVIYTNDHEPAHVHVVGKGCEAKVQLSGEDGLSLVWHAGFTRSDLRKVLIEAQAERRRLLGKWREIHGG